MTAGRRRVVLISGVLAFVAVLAAAVVVLWPSSGSADDAAQADPNQVADQYLDAFGRGDAAATGALTDDPAAATRQLTAVWRQLKPVKAVAVRSGQVQGTSAPLLIHWDLGGDRSWEYEGTLGLAHPGGRWVVHWSPTLLHPKLKAGQSMAVRSQTGSAAVLDRAGAPLLTWGAAGPVAVDKTVAPLLLPGMARVAVEQGSGQVGGWHVAQVDAHGKDIATLYRGSAAEKSVPALHSTVDRQTQAAAQAAVDSVAKPAELVAIIPSTGDIVAVAQNAAAGGDPKALHGLFPPGSTFKIVTATAVLESGTATTSTVLPCPGEQTIGTRRIRNAGFELGDVPMRTAFAHSCNTTFAMLASGLPADALPAAADQLGLGADFDIPGITTEAGAVPPTTDTPEQVENGIGQGTVQASPFGLALVSATVESGQAVTPRLWTGALKTTTSKGYRPPPRSVLSPVRAMMRQVVTDGTATTLAGSGVVLGKTGTAQFGDGTHSHGWFAGYRDDLAFAVLVEDAGTSEVAVSASAKFLANA